MSARADYFQRVRPLIGEGLSRRTVGFTNLSITGRVLDLLGACMLESVVVRDPATAAGWPLAGECGPEDATALEVLRAYFAFKNAHAPLRWAAGGGADLEIVGEWSFGAPSLRIEAATRTVRLRLRPGDFFGHLELSWQAAHAAREILLGRRALCDSEAFFASAWPFTPSAQPSSGPPAAKPPLGHLMVVGCGSVGSEAARSLRDFASRWTLVDGAKVSAFNPSRQWFGLGEVGQEKVAALARRLAPSPVRTCDRSVGPAEASAFARLLDDDPPDVAVLATGTAQDAAIAPLLWARGVPHVVAYAYPQARFFEVTTILPREGTPCAHCFRGHLYRGAEAEAPMTDEVASFLYAPARAAERDTLYVNLVAEPATKVETVRIADLAARCAVEALSAPGRRSPWMRRMLAEGTTCLLGANAVERKQDGSTAYGMTFAGQVLRLGLADVAGAEDRITCAVCGRSMDVVHRVRLPSAGEADEDAGLLAALAAPGPAR